MLSFFFCFPFNTFALMQNFTDKVTIHLDNSNNFKTKKTIVNLFITLY